MQYAILILTILLYCLFHLPALSSLHAFTTHQTAYQSRHLWLGCLLYCTVFFLTSSIMSGILMMVLSPKYYFLFALIPAALLLGLQKNRATADGSANSFQMLQPAPLTGTATYLLGQCGEANALLLFVPLTARSDLLVFPWILFSFLVTVCISYFFSSRQCRKKNTIFLLQFIFCLITLLVILQYFPFSFGFTFS